MKKLLIILLPLSLQAQQMDTLVFQFSNGNIKYLIARGGAGVGTDSLWVNHNGARSLLSSNDLPLSSAATGALGTKQGLLVSGTNIKTVNGNPLLGSGDIAISGSAAWGSVTGTLSNQTDLQNALNGKQATLVSATNIKTINGSPVLGSGDLVVSGAANYDDHLLAYQALGSAIISETVGQRLGYSNVSTAMVDGQIKFTAVYLPKAATVTGIKVYVRVLGAYTGDNNNRVGLYSYNAGVLTLVASSPNVSNLWTSAANSVQTVAFSTPYAASAGIYYCAFLFNQSAVTTAPSLASAAALNNAAMSSTAFGFTNSAKLYGTANGTDLTTPINMTAITASGIPSWIALY